ncbi:MAG: ATP-binding protein [Desulfobacterales bacterium]
MTIIDGLKPEFWDQTDSDLTAYKPMFNFRQIWKQAVIIISLFAVIPLLFLTVVDYRLTENAMENEILYRTSRFVSNTRRTVSFFLYERRFALDFIIHDNSFEELQDQQRLKTILENLKKGLSGISDLGIITDKGRQIAYVGPHPFEGKDYANQDWFEEVAEHGMHISDVFLGFRNKPHLVIAVKHEMLEGGFFVLRASVDMDRLQEMLSQLEMTGLGDAFIINHQGIIQTPSRQHGDILESIDLPVPEYSEKTQVLKTTGKYGDPLLVGYAYIQETPFIMIMVKHLNELMQPFYLSRFKLLAFLTVSVSIILMVVLIMSTHLVEKIFQADQKRLQILHEMEYANKMASIGRLAAGVAHEINNPLAIINAKAGLIEDLFTLKKEYRDDPKLLAQVRSINQAVDRCSKITRRLLSFARSSDVSVQKIDIAEVIHEVLGFINEAAGHKGIDISEEIDKNVQPIETDKGKLQQIFLNLFSNSLAALEEGGYLKISVNLRDENHICIKVADNGCGISEKDLERIFEPFFTTKSHKGGTGLGLAITYGIVQEIGGSISVNSELGKGTEFILVFPLKANFKNRGS